jgi:hypothetical protein
VTGGEEVRMPMRGRKWADYINVNLTEASIGVEKVESGVTVCRLFFPLTVETGSGPFSNSRPHKSVSNELLGGTDARVREHRSPEIDSHKRAGTTSVCVTDECGGGCKVGHSGELQGRGG